jgi:hypothetical protein
MSRSARKSSTPAEPSHRGPIPEFLAKKRAEQARGTAAGYEVVLGVFERFCQERGIETVGQLTKAVAYDFITAERQGAFGTCLPPEILRPSLPPHPHGPYFHCGTSSGFLSAS